ncbi:hypothetical protein [Mitsuaria sp. GD03876]|uniref:hypothetical protein n=1 Tax=Mitsuaria sp. GD03876 TaxID=2975399 RepID=UPI002448CCFC|nr:hypothetical protein [Mitsuaria sp. GD03876]MDH0863614.1 hypothetical protein [Mitsuaria sp. GD03876]
MSDLDSTKPPDLSAAPLVDAPEPLAKPSSRRESVDSRARLVFRSLALGLALLVVALLTVCLRDVITTFLAGAHGASHQEAGARRASNPGGGAVPAAARAAQQEASRDWPPTVVTVLSLLLVADVVLTLGLIRATFSLSVPGDAVKDDTGDKREGTNLPGVELLKATTDAIATVLKGLPKR